MTCEEFDSEPATPFEYPFCLLSMDDCSWAAVLVCMELTLVNCRC